MARSREVVIYVFIGFWRCVKLKIRYVMKLKDLIHIWLNHICITQ